MKCYLHRELVSRDALETLHRCQAHVFLWNAKRNWAAMTLSYLQGSSSSPGAARCGAIYTESW
jgi:hypothetical protein